eukprot:snap_masked-scaffold_7-processed-gene-1.43-mRNA-1 protein AED:1.00 eAED:1.00 QI:0/-1/0/0/-1/1/1/0/1802
MSTSTPQVRKEEEPRTHIVVKEKSRTRSFTKQSSKATSRSHMGELTLNEETGTYVLNDLRTTNVSTNSYGRFGSLDGVVPEDIMKSAFSWKGKDNFMFPQERALEKEEYERGRKPKLANRSLHFHASAEWRIYSKELSQATGTVKHKEWIKYRLRFLPVLEKLSDFRSIGANYKEFDWKWDYILSPKYKYTDKKTAEESFNSEYSSLYRANNDLRPVKLSRPETIKKLVSLYFEQIVKEDSEKNEVKGSKKVKKKVIKDTRKKSNDSVIHSIGGKSDGNDALIKKSSSKISTIGNISRKPSKQKKASSQKTLLRRKTSKAKGKTPLTRKKSLFNNSGTLKKMRSRGQETMRRTRRALTIKGNKIEISAADRRKAETEKRNRTIKESYDRYYQSSLKTIQAAIDKYSTTSEENYKGCFEQQAKFEEFLASKVKTEMGKKTINSEAMGFCFMKLLKLETVSTNLETSKFMNFLRKISACSLFTKAQFEYEKQSKNGAKMLIKYISEMLDSGVNLLKSIEKNVGTTKQILKSLNYGLKEEDVNAISPFIVTKLDTTRKNSQSQTRPFGDMYKTVRSESFLQLFTNRSVSKITTMVHQMKTPPPRDECHEYKEMYEVHSATGETSQIEPKLILPAAYAGAANFLVDPKAGFLFQKLKWAEHYYFALNSCICTAVVNDNSHLLKALMAHEVPSIISDASTYFKLYRNQLKLRAVKLIDSTSFPGLRISVGSPTTGSRRSHLVDPLVNGSQASAPVVFSADCLSPLLNPVQRADLYYSRHRTSCHSTCPGHRGKLLLTAIRQQSHKMVDLLLQYGLKANNLSCGLNARGQMWVLDQGVKHLRLLQAKEKEKKEESVAGKSKKKKPGPKSKGEAKGDKSVRTKSGTMNRKNARKLVNTLKRQITKATAKQDDSSDESVQSNQSEDDGSMFSEKPSELFSEGNMNFPLERVPSQESKGADTKNLNEEETFQFRIHKLCESAVDPYEEEIDSIKLLNPEHGTLVTSYEMESPLSVALEVLAYSPTRSNLVMLTKLIGKGAKVHTDDLMVLKNTVPIFDVLARTAKKKKVEHKRFTLAHNEADKFKSGRMHSPLGKKQKSLFSRFFAQDNPSQLESSFEEDEYTMKVRLKEATQTGRRSRREDNTGGRKANNELLRLFKTEGKVNFHSSHKDSDEFFDIKGLKLISQKCQDFLNRKAKFATKLEGNYAKIVIKMVILFEAVKQEKWDVIRFLAPYQIDTSRRSSKRARSKPSMKSADQRKPSRQTMLSEEGVLSLGTSAYTRTHGRKSNTFYSTYLRRRIYMNRVTASILDNLINMIITQMENSPCPAFAGSDRILETVGKHKHDYSTLFRCCIKGLYFVLLEYNISFSHPQWKRIHSAIVNHLRTNIMLKAGEPGILLDFLKTPQVQHYLLIASYPIYDVRVLKTFKKKGNKAFSGTFRGSAAKLFQTQARPSKQKPKAKDHGHAKVVQLLTSMYMILGLGSNLEEFVSTLVYEGSYTKRQFNQKFLQEMMDMVVLRRHQLHLIPTVCGYINHYILYLNRSGAKGRKFTLTDKDKTRAATARRMILQETLNRAVLMQNGISSKRALVEAMFHLLSMGGIYLAGEQIFAYLRWLIGFPLQGSDTKFVNENLRLPIQPLAQFFVFQQLVNFVFDEEHMSTEVRDEGCRYIMEQFHHGEGDVNPIVANGWLSALFIFYKGFEATEVPVSKELLSEIRWNLNDLRKNLSIMFNVVLPKENEPGVVVLAGETKEERIAQETAVVEDEEEEFDEIQVGKQLSSEEEQRLMKNLETLEKTFSSDSFDMDDFDLSDLDN